RRTLASHRARSSLISFSTTPLVSPYARPKLTMPSEAVHQLRTDIEPMSRSIESALQEATMTSYIRYLKLAFVISMQIFISVFTSTRIAMPEPQHMENQVD